MKKLVIVVLVLLSGHLYSQDKIHLMNKTILEVKVIEIETHNVKYSSINNPNGQSTIYPNLKFLILFIKWNSL